MIITDRFVVLNFPKSGSSFVRWTLREIHKKYQNIPYRTLSMLNLLSCPEYYEVILPKIDENSHAGVLDQHGTYRQIPNEHRNKRIASVTRNPLDRYISTYLFGWWEKHPPGPIERITEAFPNFPALSFEEYYQMIHAFGREDRLKGIIPNIDLGVHTIQFIQFYFFDPDQILRTITDSYIERKQYLWDMPEIHFLHQENLKVELYEFLVNVGYPAREIEFVKNAKRINVTPKRHFTTDSKGFYSEDLVKNILERDKLIYSVFPEYKNWVIQ